MARTYGQHLVVAFEALKRAGVFWSDYDRFSKNLDRISGRRNEKNYTIEQLDHDIAQFAIAAEALKQAIAEGPPTIREVNRILRLRAKVEEVHTRQVSRRKDESRNFETEYNETSTRRRVGQFLNNPQIWEQLANHRKHRRLLDSFVTFAIHDPLTRVWLSFDRHRYQDVETLIKSFRNDDWFVAYLRDVYDAGRLTIPPTTDDALEAFVEGVRNFIDSTVQERRRRY